MNPDRLKQFRENAPRNDSRSATARAVLSLSYRRTVNRHISLGALALIVLLLAGRAAAETPNRITILYDSFGKSQSLTMDWGFAALVEYGGKRILFDTGNNAQIFEHNIKAAGVDLRNLDCVVMSHRHGDHMGGLAYLLKVNPTVKIYAPKERSGVYGDDPPSSTWYRKDPSLPVEQRYYGGVPPEVIRMGSAWPSANFQLIDKNTEIAAGMHLIALVSDKPGTLELRELSLAIRTPAGLVLVVGCSHPGVEHIVQEASVIDPHINILFGGLHQIQAPDPEVERIAAVLHNQYKLERVAPGHCTGEPEFAALKRAFGDHYVYAGVGSVVDLPGGTLAGTASGGQ
ncbi:MAG TPA: MBL fold metallo-hydrolase [Chthoniobacterales bacterium]|jgi:7,8-dihydropterin-6-yl-methyl-4-(beta-D-ribofuranosyl)aminobenzene 5'-phosphate synthase|nr:MBL fold metallo-hydrolase [Chthoniobacterales bacterium]